MKERRTHVVPNVLLGLHVAMYISQWLPYVYGGMAGVLVAFLLDRRKRVRRVPVDIKNAYVLWGIMLVWVLGYVANHTLMDLLIIVSSLCLYAWSEVLIERRRVMEARHASLERQLNDLDHTFWELRKERHDYVKHIASLEHLLEEKRFNEASEYVGRLSQSYEDVSRTVSGETALTAGLLQTYERRANASDLTFSLALHYPLASILQDQTHVTQLMENVLRNAFEAAEAYKRKDNSASVTLSLQRKSAFSILTVSNDTESIPAEVLDHLYKTPGYSTKGTRGRGVGASIIADLIKENNGHLDFTHKQNTFTLKIKLPLVV
ncbi:hypothetical protein N781_04565 [Pontibacillus halophilus JSM 076056 = DSM 19796]|uniref:Histidine kinase domain-containing protein n=1 Tax=Pontibacillus halophilus JSM 076056 = DSM 19796 TaxID=1385510 RepID=A0A0A5GDX1_9BACI|nr:GHKL domain-containing protein [Pontibacillus halophilus]KGX91406.1 hypothetical protein N781_04565 [Pontibacillus halophilus JSM 076056 = DSM 19796]